MESIRYIARFMYIQQLGKVLEQTLFPIESCITYQLFMSINRVRKNLKAHHKGDHISKNSNMDTKIVALAPKQKW